MFVCVPFIITSFASSIFFIFIHYHLFCFQLIMVKCVFLAWFAVGGQSQELAQKYRLAFVILYLLSELNYLLYSPVWCFKCCWILHLFVDSLKTLIITMCVNSHQNSQRQHRGMTSVAVPALVVDLIQHAHALWTFHVKKRKKSDQKRKKNIIVCVFTGVYWQLQKPLVEVWFWKESNEDCWGETQDHLHVPPQTK